MHGEWYKIQGKIRQHGFDRAWCLDVIMGVSWETLSFSSPIHAWSPHPWLQHCMSESVILILILLLISIARLSILVFLKCGRKFVCKFIDYCLWLGWPFLFLGWNCHKLWYSGLHFGRRRDHDHCCNIFLLSFLHHFYFCTQKHRRRIWRSGCLVYWFPLQRLLLASSIMVCGSFCLVLLRSCFRQ